VLFCFIGWERFIHSGQNLRRCGGAFFMIIAAVIGGRLVKPKPT
jgi:hypothetical protein